MLNLCLSATCMCTAFYAIQVGNEKWSGCLGTRLLATCERLLHSLHTPGGPKPSWHKHCPGTSQNPPTSAEKKQKTKQKWLISDLATQQLLSSQSLHCGVDGIPPFGRMPTLSYHHCINTQLTASSCWYALITQVSSPAFVALTLKWSRTVPSNWMTTCPTYRWRETGSVFISHAFDPYRLCTFIQSFCCFDGIIDLLNCISQTFISYEHSSMFGQMFTNDYKSIH